MDGMEQKDEIIITPLPDEVQVPVPETSKGSSWQMFWITSAIALILSFVMYWLPMQAQNKLWGVYNNDTIVPVGEGFCRRFPGPAYCNDVAIDRESGLAFLACDPFKPSFYPPYELHNSSRVYGEGGIWLYDTTEPSSTPIKLPFKEDAYPVSGFHPISISISPFNKRPSEVEAGERIIRLLVVSYRRGISRGSVDIIDYYLPPTSFLTSLFGIKSTDRGGELSYVATIESDLFTAPAGIVAVRDHPTIPSDLDPYPIPSFYLTNTYQHKGVMRTVLEKWLGFPQGDVVFYNARAQAALRVGFGLDRPGPISSEESEEGRRLYVTTQDGQTHLFEIPYNLSTTKEVSSYGHVPNLSELHRPVNQSSRFKMNYPIVGIACLPPQPNALGGDIYVIGSPRHHLFHSALRDESEATVPVSILRLRPFYYVFNKTIAGADKVYYDNDPRLDQPIVKNAFTSQVDRKRFWDPATVWTELDFGAGPGSLAVREVKEQAVVLGVGGGKKGGIVLCTVDLKRPDL